MRRLTNPLMHLIDFMKKTSALFYTLLFLIIGSSVTLAGNVVVTILDAQQNPLAGVKCIVVAQDFPQPAAGGVATQWRTGTFTTDSSGSFLITNVVPSLYQVQPVGANFTTFTFSAPVTNGTIYAQNNLWFDPPPNLGTNYPTFAQGDLRWGGNTAITNAAPTTNAVPFVWFQTVFIPTNYVTPDAFGSMLAAANVVTNLATTVVFTNLSAVPLRIYGGGGATHGKPHLAEWWGKDGTNLSASISWQGDIFGKSFSDNYGYGLDGSSGGFFDPNGFYPESTSIVTNGQDGVMLKSVTLKKTTIIPYWDAVDGYGVLQFQRGESDFTFGVTDGGADDNLIVTNGNGNSWTFGYNGIFSATAGFAGNGSGLTNLSADSITGTLASSQMPTNVSSLNPVNLSPVSLPLQNQVTAVPFQNFFTKVAGMQGNGLGNRGSTNFQLRVLAYGDSVAYRQSQFIVSDLVKRFGVAGIYGLTMPAYAYTNGSYLTNDFSVSPVGTLFYAPPNSSLVFNNGGGGAYGDTVEVDYIKEPTAGTFTIQICTNYYNTNLVTIGTVNGSNSVVGFGVTNIYVGTGYWNVQLNSTTGTNRFLEAWLRATVTSGIIDIQLNQGGQALQSFNSCNLSIATNFFADLAPDLGFVELKDGPTNNGVPFASDLYTNYVRWTNSAPLANWCYILTTPTSADTNISNLTVLQNTQMANFAATYNQFASDSYTDCGSWQNLVNLGWQGDGTHLTNDAYAYLSSLTEKRIGFFETSFQRLGFSGNPNSYDPLNINTPNGNGKLAFANKYNRIIDSQIGSQGASGAASLTSPVWGVDPSGTLILGAYNGSGTTNNYYVTGMQEVGVGGGLGGLQFKNNYNGGPLVQDMEFLTSLTNLVITPRAVVVMRNATSSDYGLIVRGSANSVGAGIKLEASTGLVQFGVNNYGTQYWMSNTWNLAAVTNGLLPGAIFQANSNGVTLWTGLMGSGTVTWLNHIP